MKIYAIFNSCGSSSCKMEPLYYVEAKDVDDLKRILTERERKGEPFSMFPGWDPIEISKKEMRQILSRFDDNDICLVDEDKREKFNLFARMQSETGDDKPIIEALSKYKLFKQKYCVNIKELLKNPKKEGSLTKIGIAGEYALVSELIKRGHVACVTDKNTPKFDILASNKEGTKFAAIQVKTTAGDYNGEFLMSKREEDWYHNDNGEFGRVFFAFVRLNDAGNTYWFISARETAECIYNVHKDYLKANPKRKDTPMRVINPKREFPALKENNFEDLGL